MRSSKNAWKLQISPILLSQNSAKIRKSIDHGYILISSKGGQDTSVYKIAGLSFHVFDKCPETTNLTHFTKSK